MTFATTVIVMNRRQVNQARSFLRVIDFTEKRLAASIPQTIRAGLAAIKTLDSIFGRLHKTDPATLAAWDTASHIQRTPAAPTKTKTRPTSQHHPPPPKDSQPTAAPKNKKKKHHAATPHDIFGKITFHLSP